MKTPLRFVTLLAALALACAPESQAQITAGNVRAAQRAGTKLLDIDYDITGVTTPVSVSLQISSDGGTTWAVPATSLTGAIGSNITPGPNLRITWNAGTDWNNETSLQTRFRVKVSDLQPPEPALFAFIPAGTFTMGDTLDGQPGDAQPHTVNVSTFYLQKNLVTKADWDTVRAWGMLHGYTDLIVGSGKASTHPVHTVPWYDVVKWCNAKSEQEGLTPCYYTDVGQTVVFRTGSNTIDYSMVNWAANGYRLPTEAEWEKAARGGLAAQRFPWGNTISHGQANFYNNGGESYQTGADGYDPTWSTGAQPYTSPVGSFPANGYGLYDMAGNVYEWCWDWYEPNYWPGTDPRGPTSSSYRVLRGGSWTDTAFSVRCAYRSHYPPNSMFNFAGFRLARGQ